MLEMDIGVIKDIKNDQGYQRYQGDIGDIRDIKDISYGKDLKGIHWHRRYQLISEIGRNIQDNREVRDIRECQGYQEMNVIEKNIRNL